MLKIILLLLSTPVGALELNYNFGLKKYHYQGEKEKLALKAPGLQLTIDVKDCNREAITRFEKRYQTLLNLFPHTEGKSDIKKIQYSINTEKKTYLTAPNSRLGLELIRLPEYFIALKLQSNKSCKKSGK
ncbi:MAG: hypothetical protein K9K67_01085 [Bacteriovoracaceae bacterium]|nr:hypothetical protein [Bacteriovoracaceae bacterium]